MDIYKYIFFPSVISYESAICFIRFSDMTMHNTEKHCDYLDLADSFIYSVTVCEPKIKRLLTVKELQQSCFCA